MNADEINQGLAEYMGYRCEPTWTDSLDACEKVADKLGVSTLTIQRHELGARALVYWRCDVSKEQATGPTRSHALAAALWAAGRTAAGLPVESAGRGSPIGTAHAW